VAAASAPPVAATPTAPAPEAAAAPVVAPAPVATPAAPPPQTSAPAAVIKPSAPEKTADTPSPSEPRKPEAVGVATKPAVANPEGPATYKTVAWDDISKYSYVPPEPDADDASPAAQAKAKPKTADQIPADIRAMSGTRITIEGYVVPLDYDKGYVLKFIMLAAPLACCFAEAPPMNRWITVSNAAKLDFEYGKYNVIRVSCVFDVGEETREGYVVGIYRLKAEKIVNVNE
jgi:hypothetical protein